MTDHLDPNEHGEEAAHGAPLNRKCVSSTHRTFPKTHSPSGRASNLLLPTSTTAGCRACSSAANRTTPRRGACKGESKGLSKALRLAWPSRKSTAENEDLPGSYPYMFLGRSVGLTLFRGWTPILSRACRQIDELVVSRGLEFHWGVLQEEDGPACFV